MLRSEGPQKGILQIQLIKTMIGNLIGNICQLFVGATRGPYDILACLEHRANEDRFQLLYFWG